MFFYYIIIYENVRVITKLLSQYDMLQTSTGYNYVIAQRNEVFCCLTCNVRGVIDK